MDVISFLFWEDDCQQQIDRVMSGRRRTSLQTGNESELNGGKRTDSRDIEKVAPKDSSD